MPTHRTLMVAPLVFCLWSGGAIAMPAPGTEADAKIIVYPVPDELKYSRHNDDFTVRVRVPGGPWQDLFEYEAIVDLDNPQVATMASFDARGPVDVWIRKNNGDVRSVVVRPDGQAIKSALHGNVATFSLKGSAKVSIEFDGDRLHNLHLFANPILTRIPDRNDPNVVWFGPGVHKPDDLPGIAFNILPGKTVYIDGGAVIQGKLVINHADNVRIVGHGIIDNPERGVEITFSNNVEINGPIVLNPQHYSVYCGQSTHIQINDFKAISAKEWSDGLDFMSCSDVTINDVFLRNSDDNIAIYGKRWNFSGDVKNFAVTKAILWADKAHPINIGLHGDTLGQGEVIENLAFSDIDILEHDESDSDYQGALAISDGDNNLVRHVTFDNIRVSDFQEGRLLNFKVVYNAKYNSGSGRGVENVLVRNLTYAGENLLPSPIFGFSTERSVRNIRFENLVINGKHIRSAADGNISIGPYATGITFDEIVPAR